MYACGVTFVLEPDSKWDAEHLAKLVVQFAKGEEGFVDLVMYGNHETGDYLWFTLWETQGQALKAYYRWREPFTELLGDYALLNEPFAQLYATSAAKQWEYQKET